MTQKNTVRVTLTADGSDAEQAFNSLNSKMSRTQRESKQTQQSFQKLNQATARFGQTIQNTGLVVGTAATGLAYLTARTLESVEQMEKQADMAGTTVKSYQELTFAGKQLGVTQSAITDGLKELNNRADEWIKTSGGPAAEAFKRLNFSQAELQGQLSNTSDLFMEIVQRMQGMERAAQIRISDEIFGGQGGEQFVRMIRAGADSIGELEEKANELGITLDENTIKKAIEANKEIKSLTSQVRSQFIKVLGELAPDLEDAAQHMGDWVSNNKDFITQDVPGQIDSIADSVESFVTAVNKIPDPILYGGLAAVLGGKYAGVGALGFGAGLEIEKLLTDYRDYQSVVEGTKTKLKELKQTRDSLQDKLSNIPDEDNSRINQIRENVQERIANINKQIARYQATLSGTADEMEYYKIQIKSVNDILMGDIIPTFEEWHSKTEKQTEATKKQTQTITEYLDTMDKFAGKKRELFQDNLGFQAAGGDGASLTDMIDVAPMVKEFESAMEQIKERRDEFFMKGGKGLAPEDFANVGKESGKEFGEMFNTALSVSLQTSADNIQDILTNAVDSAAQIAGTRFAESMGERIAGAIGGTAGSIFGGAAGGAAGSLISLVPKAAEGAMETIYGEETYKASVKSANTTGTLLGVTEKMSSSLTDSIDVMSSFRDQNIALLSDISSDLRAARMGTSQAAAGAYRQFGGFEGIASGSAGTARNFGETGGGLGAGAQLAADTVMQLTGVAGLYAAKETIEEVFGKNNFVSKVLNAPFEIGGDIASNVFGGDKKVKKSGLQFGDNTLGQMARDGVDAEAFAKIKEEGGWFSSGSTEIKTRELNQNVQASLDNVFTNVASTLKSLGKGLGADMQEVLSYSLDLDRLNLKGLSAEKQQKKLKKAISTEMDIASEELFGDIIGKYQKVDEGMMETATRINRTKEILTDSLEKVNSGLHMTAETAIETTQQMKNQFGGVKEAQQAYAGFIENFYSEQEKQAFRQESLNEILSEYNKQLPKTAEGYKRMVESLEAGSEAEAALVSAASIADKYYSTIEDGSKEMIPQIRTAKEKVDVALGNMTKAQAELGIGRGKWFTSQLDNISGQGLVENTMDKLTEWRRQEDITQNTFQYAVDTLIKEFREWKKEMKQSQEQVVVVKVGEEDFKTYVREQADEVRVEAQRRNVGDNYIYG